MDSGVVVLDGVGAAMGDEPLAYCEGCRAARTRRDPGECPPGRLWTFRSFRPSSLSTSTDVISSKPMATRVGLLRHHDTASVTIS